MANDFKRFAKPSVGTSTGASADAVYTVPAGAGSSALESIIIGITLANKTSTGVTASVFLDNEDGSNDVFIVKDATVPAGSSLEIMSGNKQGYCQLHLVDEGLDTGNIIFTEEFLYPVHCRIPRDYDEYYQDKLYQLVQVTIVCKKLPRLYKLERKLI